MNIAVMKYQQVSRNGLVEWMQQFGIGLLKEQIINMLTNLVGNLIIDSCHQRQLSGRLIVFDEGSYPQSAVGYTQFCSKIQAVDLSKQLG